jgi:AcrR family transcriptional regulator
MSSNKSRPIPRRVALEPQRRPGKLRVAALLEAGAAVIAEKGFLAATMAEIAEKAGAPIGSLYRFFPNKEVLADSLIQRFHGLVTQAFDDIDARVKAMSLVGLAEALLDMMIHLHGERRALRALLEAHLGWSSKRSEFRKFMRRHLVKTLRLRCPKLGPGVASDMAVVILQNMKAVNALSQELQGEALAGALRELREMTRLYLAHRLKE